MGQIRKHGGNLKEASEIYNIPEEKIIDFSANINPLGPPPGVYRAIIDNVTKITLYPDSRNRATKEALANHLKIGEEYLLLGNGASELIFLIVNHLRPPKVWIPVPTFSEYEIAARASGAGIVHLPLLGEGLDYFSLDQLEGLGQGDLVFICNPNNPTGQLYSQEFLASILELTARKGAYVVVDESFLDFLRDNHRISLINRIKDHRQLIILYSLTKFFAIPGLRLGAMLATPNLIATLDKVRDPWNINVFAQLAGQVALTDAKYIEDTLKFFEEEREFLFNRLREIPGLWVFPPSANYILIRLENQQSTQVCEKMAQHGILVRNCNSYPLLGEHYIRVAVKARADNLALIAALANILKG